MKRVHKTCFHILESRLCQNNLIRSALPSAADDREIFSVEKNNERYFRWTKQGSVAR